MSKVTVSIDGRSYQIGCAEGEEEQLARLGEEFDQAVRSLKERVGELGDRRLSIMAGILMADQRDELRRQNEALRAEIERLRSGREDGADRAKRVEDMLVAGLDRATERVERMADALSGDARPPASEEENVGPTEAQAKKPSRKGRRGARKP